MAKRKSNSGAGDTAPAAASTTTNTNLQSTLSTKPWAFLQPNTSLHTQLADSAKQILDPLATSVVNDQTVRKQLNKKRKRSNPDDDEVATLQLKNLYVEGFTSGQVWEQATRILEAAGGEIERDVALLSRFGDMDIFEDGEEEDEELEGSELEGLGSESEGESLSDAFSGEEGAEIDEDEDEEGDEIDEEGMDDFDAMEDDEEDIEKLSDEDDEEGSVASEQEDSGTYVEDKFGLNDGFFSIDDFNKQTELLERQDMKGGADDDDDDEEEEINWHADPTVATDALPKANQAPIGAGGDDDDMDDDSEEDGPTFGNADLNAPDSDSDDDAEPEVDPEATSYGDTSNIRYADFFQAPPRKASSKRSRALPKTQPAKEVSQEDVDRAMADVRRDLFDDEDEMEEEAEEMDDGEAQGPRSTHEKQRAKIADEIRRLEAANVAKKEWTMAGEARAVERPVNSLIEEDLDFERVGKPVPVVTNETSEDIEELVKRRILANEFDEVIRRRPGVGDSKGQRRARFELADTKPQESLAEMYEAEHQRANDPNYVDTKDKKLMREHAEIKNLWQEVSSQLDTLCNWHYKPKTPQANINVVTDAATITMEDARPTAGSAAGGPSALAPQEIYAPGDDGKVSGEVLLKTGASISKDEMSREEKARKRRQNKAQYKSSDKPAEPKGKAAEKQQLVSDLKKGGVKVIDKEGKVTNMDGGKDRKEHGNKGDRLKL